jgi:hypothetical protein
MNLFLTEIFIAELLQILQTKQYGRSFAIQAKRVAADKQSVSYAGAFRGYCPDCGRSQV